MEQVENNPPPPPPPSPVIPPPFNAKDFVIQKGYWLHGEKNYFQWSQLIRQTLKGCDLIDHLEGDPPVVTAPNFSSWDKDDSVIITWLWNSISPEISRNCMFLSTARAIWDYLSCSYSMKQDMSACYDLKRKIFNSKQGNLPVTEYFGALNALWIELDQYQNLKMECSNDAAILNAVVERDRIFDFLAGLNVEFDPIRVQILGKEKLPTLTEVFYTVRSEETRRHAMLNQHPPDVSALVAGKVPQPSSEIFYCDYCKKPWHHKSM